MVLTDQEKRMLAGERGYPVQKAMQIMTALGESVGAEKMIEIAGVHTPGAAIMNAGEAALLFLEEMQSKGGRVCRFTTTNPTSIDPSQWRELGMDEDVVRLQLRMTQAYQKLGVVTCACCTPYLIGNVPRFGEHIAWGESSAVVFANSVLGARTNREGGPSALSAALIGRVPAYGFHFTENRYGRLQVHVDIPVQGIADYGTLGYYIGKIAGQDTPVITGIPAHATLDELKSLGSALASSGAVTLFHVVGVTPEARTLKEAFGGKKPALTLNYGKKERQETEAHLNSEKTSDIDWIYIGCPQCSLQEIQSLAEALAGKRIHKEVDMWICTSVPLKVMADQLGYTQAIREAGAKLVCDTCAVQNVHNRRGRRSMTTNSAKMAHYTMGELELNTHYGDVDQIIAAAVSKQWRV